MATPGPAQVGDIAPATGCIGSEPARRNRAATWLAVPIAVEEAGDAQQLVLGPGEFNVKTKIVERIWGDLGCRCLRSIEGKRERMPSGGLAVMCARGPCLRRGRVPSRWA